MQARAFVLINAELGSEQEVVRALKAIENISEVHTVYGVYDIVLLVEAESLEKVKETITSRIRKVPKIRSTLTMVVVESA